MFDSFFLAGFECATGYNSSRQWIDQVAATRHDLHADEDYARLGAIGIRGVRDGVRWPLVDVGRRYDFSTVEPIVDAARRHEMKVIFDLFHFGYPDGVDPFSDDFAARFEDYCHACARYVAAKMPESCYFTPVNEPSFFAWAAGDAGLFAPHEHGRSFELKVRLCEAAIRGIDAIRDACPSARIVNVDPICRVVAPADEPDREQDASWFNENCVFESLDIISGRKMPELGGSPAHLDVVGVNYYWTNQWEIGRSHGPLSDDDPRRVRLGDLVRCVWERYGAEVLVSETSHVGELRPAWIDEVAEDALELLAEGVPLRGVCLYPVLGMPEWHEPDRWTNMGLWDVEHHEGELHRVPCDEALEALDRANARIEDALRALEGLDDDEEALAIGSC